MNCIDYRRLLQSDPGHRGADSAAHRLACQPCARFTEELQQQDRQLRDALMVKMPDGLEARVMLAATSRARSRRRWYSIAAGAVVGIAISFALLTGGGRSLHDSVVAHIYHEPELLLPSDDAMATPQLSAVLKRAGVAINGDTSNVSYAGLCFFRGHLVPHMVVQSDSGPVTVLLLPDEQIDEPIAIDEPGFAGTIVPVRGGSVAVVGNEADTTREVSQRLVSAVEWET
ncbi:MAG: DUF3379 family protein [Gammaproteobacteria bacterium]|nr:DUF3379 family protein [Gammaproteobacteria bacterium]